MRTRIAGNIDLKQLSQMKHNQEQNFIGVTGCLLELPDEFPIEFPENSGNMVHANAPIKIFEKTAYIKDTSYLNYGFKNFASLVNEKCSHLVITLANTLRLNEADGTKYERTIEFLKKIEKPVVVFGLGIQAKGADINAATLPPQAIEFIKILSQKTKLLGVRGKSTKAVLERLCGVDNVFVTGCPSVFSNIEETYKIPKNLGSPTGRPAFSGTRYFDDTENLLLQQSIKLDHWLIEPVNKFNHQFWQKVMQGCANIDTIPYFTKRFIKNDPAEFETLRRHFECRYQIFRTTRDWYRFNKEFVSFSYGTRFHANMAALISGKPALWFTHDERPQELTEFMHLPSVKIEEARDLDLGTHLKKNLYDDFFDHYPKLIDNFDFYLNANELPSLKKHRHG